MLDSPRKTTLQIKFTENSIWLKIWGSTSHEFNPDRFLDEAGKYVGRSSEADGIITSNLVPFSVGKRDCLGKVLADKELILFFVGLMNQFEFMKIEARIVFPILYSIHLILP